MLIAHVHEQTEVESDMNSRMLIGDTEQVKYDTCRQYAAEATHAEKGKSAVRIQRMRSISHSGVPHASFIALTAYYKRTINIQGLSTEC